MTQTPVSHDSQPWKAWEAYKQTDEYENTLNWYGKPLQQPLWAAFMAGFSARHSHTTEPARQPDPAPYGRDKLLNRLVDDIVFVIAMHVGPEGGTLCCEKCARRGRQMRPLIAEALARAEEAGRQQGRREALDAIEKILDEEK